MSVAAIGEWIMALLATSVLFGLPGWALLHIWPDARQLTWAERATLSLGLGMALFPVILLLTASIGLNLGPLYAWLPILIALLWLVWPTVRSRWATPRPTLAPQVTVAPEGWRTREDWRWPTLALSLVVSSIVLVRSLAVAGLDVPLWGDSLHHTMIVQLLLDHGGLFKSWQPYAELQSFSYHFGFHSLVAGLVWMTNMDVPRAVVVMGQILNAAAVISLYPLALRLGRSRWAGVAALLLAGMLVPMPMMYVNWGRYTQLTGQLIMPVAILLVWMLLEAPDRARALLGLAMLSLAGMALTHYRIAIFAACFGPAWLLLGQYRVSLRTIITRLSLLGVGIALLITPWALRILEGLLPQLMGEIAAASADGGSGAAAAEAVNAPGQPLSFFLPDLVWYSLPIILAWACWRRERSAMIVALWWFFTALVVNPQWLGLPGAGTLTNFALLLAAYIPAGLLVGSAVGWILHQPQGQLRQGFVTCGMVALALWGMQPRLADREFATYALVTPADQQAMAWIDANLPHEARFLPNSFFSNPLTVVGSDGGWWLPLLSKRASILPPILYVAEQGPWPAYSTWVNAPFAAIARNGIEHPDTLALLRERGVTHIYIGARQGTAGDPDQGAALAPERLLASPAFEPIYQQDQVWIFVLR
ncbi:MAG: hypothetical protein AB4911_17635 [Oscillochloridaceae bacterium umkhey_bin13]